MRESSGKNVVALSSITERGDTRRKSSTSSWPSGQEQIGRSLGNDCRYYSSKTSLKVPRRGKFRSESNKVSHSACRRALFAFFRLISRPPLYRPDTPVPQKNKGKSYWRIVAERSGKFSQSFAREVTCNDSLPPLIDNEFARSRRVATCVSILLDVRCLQFLLALKLSSFYVNWGIRKM